MTPEDCPSWRTPRILVTLMLVFVCGSMAGGLTMRLGLPRMLYKPMPYWTEGGKQVSMQKFRKELDLTADQARRIETILDDFVMYYQTLQAQMEEVRGNGKSRILQILTPDQEKKFKAMLSDLQARQIK